MVGDEMRRGISGGQKKRLTTGEMLVGPEKEATISHWKKTATDRGSASTASSFEGINMGVRNTPDNDNLDVKDIATGKRGMVLPFQPLSLAFDHVNYYVDMPAFIGMDHPSSNPAK